jgi:hypothetical protein
MSEIFPLSDVKYIKRITVGNIDPQNPLSEDKKEEQMTLLNRCLNEIPKGKIIGKDVGFAIYQVGEHQLTLQSTTYHIGFLRKPNWIEEM